MTRTKPLARSLALGTIALGLAVGGAAPAYADKADLMFKKGKKLLAERKYAEACGVFAEVDGMDPGVGAKLNVARCFEEWGKLGTAWRWYSDAEKMAAEAADPRAAKIKDLAEELDVSVPRVTILVPKGADPDIVATITLDGEPFEASRIGEEQRVDPGPHMIEFTVSGETQRKMVPLERGGSSELTLEIPKGTGKKKTRVDEDGGDEDTEEDDPSAPRPGRTQRILGLSLVGGGVAAGVVAGVLTLGARNKYRDALDNYCMSDAMMCDDRGLEITGDARSRANLATVVTVIGGALVIGGIVMYVLVPDAVAEVVGDERSALYVTPVVGAEGGGVVFGGRY